MVKVDENEIWRKATDLKRQAERLEEYFHDVNYGDAELSNDEADAILYDIESEVEELRKLIDHID
ncbi:MAG: hypothetical protein CJD30_03620 [Sulfuricurvum sp. PD_MW2]|uniref:hypothetical protein n=1 Tax=Sulfuricurvum sp. PD_MW2 TaxID=2027917 RepID=UPI000C065B8C|nr:hypothetical protein [Sulfuricurvum sp. PD_MW2]PHM18062.1 MAG: hypothetical protein CJD30_03620 [Sulfuricurvum sp. PD_MW2]